MPERRQQLPGPVVLGVAVYPPSLAATRLRIHQLQGHLAADGIELRTWSFFGERDIAAWYGRSHLWRLRALARGFLRIGMLPALLRGADVVLVQREMLPLGPPLLERLVARRRRVIWDVDDSVWVPWPSPTAGRVPRWLRAPADKYGSLCRRADEVWAGSEVLAHWCRQRNENVMVAPTVVEVPLDPPDRPLDRVVGWIGSHSTAAFLEGLLPALGDVEPPVRLIVVGARPHVPEGLVCEVFDWSPEAERAALERCAVGLYPIDRGHPLAEGKCGLKAILFMSQAVPVVVTPTTTNAAIVRHGVEGLHAEDGADWIDAVTSLLADERRWEVMTRAAHERARTEYSLDAWGPRLAHRVRQLVDA